MDTTKPNATPAGALRVLTRDEAARMLGLSRLGLDRLHLEGTGPARVRLSARRVGYRESDLLAWLDSRVERVGKGDAAGTPASVNRAA